MELYQILGWLNVFVYISLTIKVPLKEINKKLRNRNLAKLIGFLAKYHKYLGVFMIIIAFVHAYILGALFRFNSGTLVLIGVILTAIFGILIRVIRNKLVLTIHKFLSIIVLILMINHIYL